MARATCPEALASCQAALWEAISSMHAAECMKVRSEWTGMTASALQKAHHAVLGTSVICGDACPPRAWQAILGCSQPQQMPSSRQEQQRDSSSAHYGESQWTLGLSDLRHEPQAPFNPAANPDGLSDTACTALMSRQDVQMPRRTWKPRAAPHSSDCTGRAACDAG